MTSNGCISTVSPYHSALIQTSQDTDPVTQAVSCTWKQQQGGRERGGNERRAIFFVYTPNALISLLMIVAFWCSSWDTQTWTPASNRKMTGKIILEHKKWQAVRQKHRETNSSRNRQTHWLAHTHTHRNTSRHRPERWSREQRVFLTRASLVYSGLSVLAGLSVIALTGGIPDGLLHCLHAAAPQQWG